MTDNELLQALYIGMQDMKEDIKGIQVGVQGVKDEVQGVKDEVQDMKDDIQSMKTDVRALNTQVRSIEMTLENEINRNIKIIAEGHLDLSKKLDKTFMLDHEKELLMIRVNVLEDDVRKIKEQFQIV